jgi:hypothetical protein
MRRIVGLTVATLALWPALAAAEDEAPPLSIYGFARLDILANDSRMSSLDQAAFVETEPGTGQVDGALTMTPRLSRIGLSLDRWQLTDEFFAGEGKLEIDFGGSGDGTSVIRLRQAYGAVNVKNRAELLVGQTTDTVSPLFPAAQNDTQLRFAGNLGDRRPQLRLAGLPSKKLYVAVAAAASGVLDQADRDFDGQLDAMASAMPMLQWLVEGRHRTKDGNDLRVGISGHVARTEADGVRTASSSVNLHVFVPIEGHVAVLGEAYSGKNLADVGGGIGQGVNAMTGEAIRSSGGWAEIATFPTARHMIAAGASIDTVREEDIEPGDRRRNSTGYGVLRYKPKPALQLGLEYLYWRTRYKDMSDGRANRFDVHFSVFF